MQCLILAGGLGTRMKPMTDRLPKALIPVAGQPFVHYQLKWLAGQGVRRVVLALGHLGDHIRDFVGDGRRWGLEITCIDEGDRLRGTAGAIRLAIDEGVMDKGFFVLYGDSFLPIELALVWRASQRGERPLMCVYRNDGRWDESNVVYRDGRVELYEKGRDDAAALGMRHIDYGLSVLTRDAVADQVPTGATADLDAVFQHLIQGGGLLGFEVFERFHEIGSAQGLADLEAYLAANPEPPVD
ncbi:MAG: NTP transferase domain-containing protein [Rhodospirillales bacterium]|jgi:NDP-sugar pyrophosphorylase family protein|nr:NTP transferase domain-containing protein [Rhodospirillales bacterium]